MQIQYQSDLHLEFFTGDITYKLANVGADIIVLAGDIGRTKQRYFQWVLEQTHGVPTILLLGNHESYGTSIQRAHRKWQQAMVGSQVHILTADQPIFINGIRFIGDTLWTDYSLFGDDSRDLAMRAATAMLNDHQQIRYERDNKFEPFTPSCARQLHLFARAAIERQLTVTHDGPTIVVSHHAPCLASVAPCYANDILTPAFCSDLSKLIKKFQPEVWIHGHMHNSTKAEIGRTQILANPRGYEGHEMNPEFDPEATLSL